MKTRALIIVAILGVALYAATPAFAKAKPKKVTSVAVTVNVQALAGGSCQQAGWAVTVNGSVRGIISCRAASVGKVKRGQKVRVCLAVPAETGYALLGTTCRTAKAGTKPLAFLYILNGKPGTGQTAGATTPGQTAGTNQGSSQATGQANGADTGQACKGENCNQNANTQQQNAAAQANAQAAATNQTTVVVNVPPAPAPIVNVPPAPAAPAPVIAAPSVSFLNVPAHRLTGSPSNAGTENYCVQTANATSVTISNSVAQDTVGPVQDKGAGKFCFDFTPMQTSLFPSGFTVVWDTLTATATGPGGSATATASIQVQKPPM